MSFKSVETETKGKYWEIRKSYLEFIHSIYLLASAIANGNRVLNVLRWIKENISKLFTWNSQKFYKIKLFQKSNPIESNWKFKTNNYKLMKTQRTRQTQTNSYQINLYHPFFLELKKPPNSPQKPPIIKCYPPRSIYNNGKLGKSFFSLFSRWCRGFLF